MCCRIDLIHLFSQQWFPKATTTTSWKSISREASAWTTRKPAPSSCPSACLWTTTLQRPWETSGCRSNPSPLPVRPRHPAAQVLLIHQPTATAPASPTKRLPEACRQCPAIGLAIKKWETLPFLEKKNGLYVVKHFTVWSSARRAVEQVLIFACEMWELWEARWPQTFAASQWYSDECSQIQHSLVVFKFCFLLVVCCLYRDISETFDCWLFYSQSTVFLYLYSNDWVPFSLNNCCIFCW